MAVDVHTHLGASSDYATSLPSRYVAALAGAGIGHAVAFPHERGPAPSYTPRNDQILALARRYPQIVPFARLDLEDEGWAHAELARVAELGARGIKLHPQADALDPRAPAVERVLDAIAERRLPLIIHSNRGLHSAPSEWAPHFLSRPGLRVIVGHAGFFLWREALELAARAANVYLELSLCPALIVEKLLEFCPPERLLFGSDFPYNDPTGTRVILERAARRVCPDDPARLPAILDGNARRLLEVEAGDPLPEAARPAAPLELSGLLSDEAGRFEIPVVVYHLAQRSCSFRLLERDGADPLDGRLLRFRWAGEWIAVPVRVRFGSGIHWSAEHTAVSDELRHFIDGFCHQRYRDELDP